MTDTHHWIEMLDMSVFAERLKLLRSARNITQARLAELLDISPRVYNRWEKGNSTPHFDTIIKIADILQVSIDEFAGRKEPSTKLMIRNHQLHSLCQKVDQLPDQDQQALVIMMDSLVKKTQMERLLE